MSPSKPLLRHAHSARAMALALAVAGAVPAVASFAAYTIDGGVIASGVSEFHGNACSTMSATSGQAVFGGAAGAGYALYSGFWRAYPANQESVFSNSFENCGN